MASIKGIQLKAIKEGIGHDRAGFQANIYHGSKKIGSVLDDGWGGELNIDIVSDLDVFDEKAKAYHEEQNEKVLAPEESLIYDLLELSQLEKELKSSQKKGYSFIMHIDHRPRNSDGGLSIDVPIPYPSTEIFSCSVERHIQEVLNESKPVKYKVYRELSDFVIV